MCISVDFPAPFSPTTAWISPAGTSSVAPRFAVTAPNRLTMPVIRTAGRDDRFGSPLGPLIGWTAP